MLHAQAQRGCTQGGWNRALQADWGRAGHWAGRGAACQAAGQRVAGGGAAGALAPEKFRAEAGVAARVLGQVVAAGEALGAERAGEALLAGVRPVVAGQLVRACELLVASRPVASEGALTTHVPAPVLRQQFLLSPPPRNSLPPFLWGIPRAPRCWRSQLSPFLWEMTTRGAGPGHHLGGFPCLTPPLTLAALYEQRNM